MPEVAERPVVKDLSAEWPSEVMLALRDDDEVRICGAFNEPASEIDEAVRMGSYGKTGFLLLDSLYARAGDTALHMAARNGKIKCSLQLILQGSDCYALNRDKKTPTTLAQRNNRIIFKGLADIKNREKDHFAKLVEGLDFAAKMVWIELIATIDKVDHKTVFIEAVSVMEKQAQAEFMGILQGMPDDLKRHFISAMAGMSTEEGNSFITTVSGLSDTANAVFLPSMAKMLITSRQVFITIIGDWESDIRERFIMSLVKSYRNNNNNYIINIIIINNNSTTSII